MSSGIYIKTKKARKNMSLARQGKTWEILYGKEKADELKERQKKRMLENKINLGRKPSEKIKEKMTKSHLNRTNEERNKSIGDMLKQRKISNNENKLLFIIEKNNLPFNYTGNGQVMFNGFCPDFLSKNPKHIIELFGVWHYSKEGKERDKRRFKAYSSLGYKTLVIHNSELNNEDKVVNKIREFIKQ